MFSNIVDLQSSFVARLSEAAIGDDSWHQALKPMQAMLGVAASSIEVLDKRTGDLRLLGTEAFDEDEQRIYEERLFELNPRFSLLPGLEAGQVRADRHLAPELERSAGEYYEWLGRACGTRYFAGVKLFETHDFLALISIHVPEKHGWIDRSTEDLFRTLAPHVANSLAIHLALAGRDDRLALIEEGAAGRGKAYALLDSSGRIIECSREFQDTAAQSGALAISDRRLSAQRAADRERLGRLLHSVLGGDESTQPPVPVRIETSQGSHGLLVRGVRLGQKRELFGRLRPAAMLVLIDLDAPTAHLASELRSAWGLTVREAELAALIAAGVRLDEAGSKLGISELTVRHHLKAIFRKMDVERQSDLVRLVTRLSA